MSQWRSEHSSTTASRLPGTSTNRVFQTRKSIRESTPRPTLQPGAILILLAGRFRGKRVVLLKNLDQGVLLVTGPFKINGVPLRRVNARYVIATSQKVDLKGVDDKKLGEVSQPKYSPARSPRRRLARRPSSSRERSPRYDLNSRPGSMAGRVQGQVAEC